MTVANRLLRATRDTGLKGTVDVTLGWALTALMGLSVLNVLWQVFTRFILSSPSAFTDELARYLLIWIGLLGGAYVAGQRLHLAIDLLPQALKGRAALTLGVLIESCILAFALVVMVFGGGKLVQLTLLLGQSSAALGVPLGAVYTAMPVSGALIAFYSALSISDNVRALRGNPPRMATTGESTAHAFGEHEREAAGLPDDAPERDPSNPAN